MAMYDKNLDNNWRVEIDFDEDETHTHATVRAQRGDGKTLTTLGDAYRNPKDSSQSTSTAEHRDDQLVGEPPRSLGERWLRCGRLHLVEEVDVVGQALGHR